MADDLPGDELFIGQVVALMPLSSLDEVLGDDAGLRAVLAGSSGPGTRPRGRARTFSIVTSAPRRGILLLGGKEVEVSIRPLDLDTPLEAAVFRIVSITGRRLRVKRAMAAPESPAR